MRTRGEVEGTARSYPSANMAHFMDRGAHSGQQRPGCADITTRRVTAHQLACRHESREKRHTEELSVRSWDGASEPERATGGAGTIGKGMINRFTRLALILGVGTFSLTGVGAQSRPLPDQDAFLKETRKHLQTDSSAQSSYVYVETRREVKLDKDGRTTEQSVKVYESYPGLPGQPRWERLISENGKPVAAADLADQDRDRTKKATAMARRLETEPEKEHARQLRDWEKHRDERDEAVTDIYTVFDIKMTGRERIEGHDTIAFTLTPRPASNPKTREGDLMKYFLVHAWISES